MEKPYKKIFAWKKAHEFMLEVYKITSSFPIEERFGIVSQLRRAAISVPTNIVEGSYRRSQKDYVRFLRIANASLAECDYLLFAATELKILKDDQYKQIEAARSDTGAILHLLIKALSSE